MINVYKDYSYNIICIYIKQMSSSTTLYRKANPEYYEKEKIRDRERMRLKYNENPEHRERVKQQALARYYRLKEQKNNGSISVN